MLQYFKLELYSCLKSKTGFSIGMLCVQSADDLYQKIAKSHHVYDHYQIVSSNTTTENQDYYGIEYCLAWSLLVKL